MGRFKELEIPDQESIENVNLTLFDIEDENEPLGYSRTIRYFAEAKALLEFIDFKLKNQRKNIQSTTAHPKVA